MKKRLFKFFGVALAGLLSGCGGGGGGGGATDSTAAPYILANVFSFPTGQVPAGFAQAGENTVATVWVADRSGGSPITNASVSVNGVAVAYVAADQTYEASLNVAPAATVTLSVTVGGKTYTVSTDQLSTYPIITSPASGATWSRSASHTVAWSGINPTAATPSVMAITDSAGNIVWPSTGDFVTLTLSPTAVLVPSGQLTTGDRLVIAGDLKSAGIPAAATDSILVVGGFTYTPVTVSDGSGPAASLQSIAVTPANATIASGRTSMLTATGTYSDGSSLDLTTQAAWSSSDSAKVTVSSTGLVTGLTYGSATITAALGGVSSSSVVRVFQPTSSPTPPLGQSVAYQVDYAHSGRAVFADAVTFPTTVPAWSVTLNGSVSYPLVANGKVFVLTEAKSLYALNEQSGSIVWGPVSLSSTVKLPGHAYDNGKLFVVSADGMLSSFDASTGQAGWSTQLTGQYAFDSAPTARNGVVYVAGSGGAGTLYAVDEADGAVLWIAPVANGQDSSPTISDDGVFVSYPCQVYKFDPVSGGPLWHYAESCGGGGGYTAAYANGRLYARDWTTPTAKIFDAASGSILGNFTSAQIPAVSTSTSYYLDAGTLRAFDISSSSEVWHFVGDGSLVSAPILINSAVIVGSASGTVYALNAVTGSQIWSASAGAAIAQSTDMTSGQLTGFGAGDGYLVVPAGTVLTAWHVTGP